MNTDYYLLTYLLVSLPNRLIEQQCTTHRKADIGHVEDARTHGEKVSEVTSSDPEATYFFGRFFARFQTQRGSVIVIPLTSCAISSKSLSPVTNTSALTAHAEVRTH